MGRPAVDLHSIRLICIFVDGGGGGGAVLRYSGQWRCGQVQRLYLLIGAPSQLRVDRDLYSTEFVPTKNPEAVSGAFYRGTIVTCI